MSDWLTVAVTMRRSDAAAYVEARDAISHDWIAFLHAQRVLPVLLSSASPEPLALLRASGARALLLTNGEDVGAGNPARDALEQALLDHAVATRLPVLGVCRGLQLINTYFGGSVVRDLSAEAHVAVRHEIALSGPLAVAAGAQRVTTNSFHRCGVTADGLAPSLQPLARADDGVIEALSHASLPIQAVQWHPERPGSHVAVDDHMFSWLREAVRA